MQYVKLDATELKKVTSSVTSGYPCYEPGCLEIREDHQRKFPDGEFYIVCESRRWFFPRKTATSKVAEIKNQIDTPLGAIYFWLRAAGDIVFSRDYIKNQLQPQLIKKFLTNKPEESIEFEIKEVNWRVVFRDGLWRINPFFNEYLMAVDPEASKIYEKNYVYDGLEGYRHRNDGGYYS